MTLLEWALVALSLLGNYWVVKKDRKGYLAWIISNIGWIVFRSTLIGIMAKLPCSGRIRHSLFGDLLGGVKTFLSVPTKINRASFSSTKEVKNEPRRLFVEKIYWDLRSQV